MGVVPRIAESLNLQEHASSMVLNGALLRERALCAAREV